MINKTDLAPHVGASSRSWRTTHERMRGPRPFVMTNLKSGAGLDTVIGFIEKRGLLVT